MDTKIKIRIGVIGTVFSMCLFFIGLIYAQGTKFGLMIPLAIILLLFFMGYLWRSSRRY
jgi:hypothetical protein